MEMTIKNIKVLYQGNITLEEADEVARQFIHEEMAKGNSLTVVMLTPAGDEIVIEGDLRAEPGQIKRVRRITGYLSDQGNFNDGKKAELRDRIPQRETYDESI